MKKVEMTELRAVSAGEKLDLILDITLPIPGYGKLQIGFGKLGFGWNFFRDGNFTFSSLDLASSLVTIIGSMLGSVLMDLFYPTVV